ncbi:hypothetical protein [Aestuariibacter sp. A3R04]|uniref:hypothetical protein n=1 Tax=Aestuariibacter sp. A3R04 TaxID=2841571 RepID=UPI001C08CEBC|nr:hypothetical protein [Aestuariibacter sp. A3R04]MBU3023203.1 hypothetical protein [Aestuariibacter sp. A3R04]
MKKQFAVAWLLISPSVLAGLNEYEAAAGAFCEKMKMCINEEMEKQMSGNIPPEMRQMVDSMSAQMCQQYVPNMLPDDTMSDYDELLDAGTECLQEMINIPCDQFESMNEPASCKKAQAMADSISKTRN